MSAKLSRRRIIPMLAVTVAGVPLIAREAFAQATGNTGDRLILDADVCAITPETTEGPFYFDPALERTDITEGRPGLPTKVRLQIVDERCEPLPGARVDIWHCDALGIYSGYQRQLGNLDTRGETFMRGTQFADADGIAEFETIYPGWYPGRTPHIHFKVFVDSATLLTGQLFFPDEVSRKVYATVAPYTDRSNGPDTPNDRDGIARRAGNSSVAAVEELPEAYLVQLIIGVEPIGQFGGMSFPSSG
jgi:protocatechuate 3,4-dioxygenase beta subunit